MLFIALLFALLLYVVLGYVWVAAQPQIGASVSKLETLRHMIFDLQLLTPLALLKWAIIIMAFYLVADTMMSLAGKKRRRARKATKSGNPVSPHDASSTKS